MKITVKVPRVAAKQDPAPPISFSERPEHIDGLRMGFLDNTKPNSDKFLQQISYLLE